jgi:hypothetical protein
MATLALRGRRMITCSLMLGNTTVYRLDGAVLLDRQHMQGQGIICSGHASEIATSAIRTIVISVSSR